MTIGGSVRPLRHEDAKAVLYAFISDPAMRRHGVVRDLAEARAYVAELMDPDSVHHPRAIVDGDDRLVGLVCVDEDTDHRSGRFWYWMKSSHRGRGWTASAAATVANAALSEWGLERLELAHRATSPASERIARAAGFVREGVERGKLVVDGERIDVVTYGRLDTDPWPSARLRALPGALELATPAAELATEGGIAEAIRR